MSERAAAKSAAQTDRVMGYPVALALFEFERDDDRDHDDRDHHDPDHRAIFLSGSATFAWYLTKQTEASSKGLSNV